MAPKRPPKPTESAVSLDSDTLQLEEDNSKINQLILDRLSSIENKLDISNKLVKTLEGKVKASEEKLSKVEKELEVLTVNFNEISARLAFLEAENKVKSDDGLAAKIAINTIQQRGRLFSIRVMNMKKEVKSSREAASYIYDSLLKPTFTDQQGNHPGWLRTVEYCHLLPSNKDKTKYPGFNYILRFHGRYYKQAIIENKKEIVSTFNTANDANVKISQDFTYVNRQALSCLHKMDDVDKVTVRGDRLLVKLASEGSTALWREIINPFARNLADMIDSQ